MLYLAGHPVEATASPSINAGQHLPSGGAEARLRSHLSPRSPADGDADAIAGAPALPAATNLTTEVAPTARSDMLNEQVQTPVKTEGKPCLNLDREVRQRQLANTAQDYQDKPVQADYMRTVQRERQRRRVAQQWPQASANSTTLEVAAAPQTISALGQPGGRGAPRKMEYRIRS